MYTDTIACAFKKRVEQRAVEELRSISESCIVSGWGNVKSLGSFCTVLQDNRDDLGTLMHQMLVNTNDNTRCSSSKTPLFPWQVCLSAKQHLGGYLETEDELVALKRNVSFLKRAPPRCHRSNLTSEILADKNNCVEREFVEEARAKSASNVSKNNSHVQDACGGKLCGNAQSAVQPVTCSSSTNFKFHHSKYTDYYIKNYREQITDEGIRKHIYEWSKKNNKPKLLSEKKSTKKTQEVTIPKPSFTLYRFCISNNKSFHESACLKVGPCPSMSEQKESKTAHANKITKSATSEKAKTQTNMAPAAADRRLDQKRKEVKTISSLKCQNTFQSQSYRENTSPCPESKDGRTSAPKTDTSEGKLKKVQLIVHSSSDSPRIVPKTSGRVYANKTKTRLLGVYTKPLIQYCKSGSQIHKVAREPTFGDMEFLRITTPKPLTSYQSHTPSNSDESPGFSPAKSVEISPTRSPVPSLSGTRLRSQVIAEILMNREPQVVFPKNSNFQACITPSNYSTRRAETQCRKRDDLAPMDLEQKFSEDQNVNENRAKRVSSQPSIPRIGPFISG